jgi:hypothetical protein
MEKLIEGVTPYPAVNEVLEALVEAMIGVLGERLVGVSLYGSLALGDFDPATSDIDFVAVTDGVRLEDVFDKLKAMHMGFQEREPGRSMHLEGCYLPLGDLRRHDPEGGPYLMLNEGNFYQTRLGGDWIIQRHILREHGVAVYGPELRGWIDPVSADDLRWGVADVLSGWWTEQAENPEWIGQRAGYEVFTVQTMCRALYTLDKGEIASKPASVRWAAETLDEPWRSLARRALEWKEGDAFAPLEETVAMVRYTIDISRRWPA